MKIAVFVSYLPPHHGGIEVVTEQQIKNLSSAGHDISVVTSACGAEPGTFTHAGYKIIRIRAWNYFEEKMGAVFPIFAPSLWWQSYRVVKQSDVVHAHDAFYMTSLAAAVWARLLKKPLVLTQHVDMVPHPNGLVRFAQQVVYATTGRFIIRSSSRVIVLNTRVADFIKSKGVGASKIIFLANAVDTSRFKPVSKRRKSQLRRRYGVSQDALLALFVGRFVPKKGIDVILGMAPISGVEIVLGGGKMPAKAKRSDRHFMGVVSRADAPEIFQMCDIFVLPSQGEGFPVTIQEAMASGLAVVTTDDPAYMAYELDRRYISFVSPTADTLQAALARLASQPDLIVAAGAYARGYAQVHFDQRLQTAKLGALYESLVGV